MDRAARHVGAPWRDISSWRSSPAVRAKRPISRCGDSPPRSLRPDHRDGRRRPSQAGPRRSAAIAAAVRQAQLPSTLATPWTTRAPRKAARVPFIGIAAPSNPLVHRPRLPVSGGGRLRDRGRHQLSGGGLRRMRSAAIERNTKETRIQATLEIEGRGRYDVATGIRFFDHMLELFTKHGGFDLKLQRRRRPRRGPAPYGRGRRHRAGPAFRQGAWRPQGASIAPATSCCRWTRRLQWWRSISAAGRRSSTRTW